MAIVLISVWLSVVFIIWILIGYFGSRRLTGWSDADKAIAYGFQCLFSLFWPFILIGVIVAIIPTLCIHLGFYLKGTKWK